MQSSNSLPHPNTKSFIGQPVSCLPTPSLLIRKSVVQRNITQLHQDVEAARLAFRPHVKTLKTLEVTRMMLGDGKYKKIVASTLAEIRGVLPLVQEGLLEEVLYGLPIRPSALAELAALRTAVRIVLMIDHEQHIDALEAFQTPDSASSDDAIQAPWDVFIKLDVGSRRAGVPISSPRLERLVRRALASPAVSVYGFYCHAGHSYECRTREAAEAVLQAEVDAVAEAASLVPQDRELVVSFGATPTAHVVRGLRHAAWGANVILELHAGNFPANDLQQVATGLVAAPQMAVHVLAEVCGVYPERNEALVNAGTVALSKETTVGVFPGFGNVVGKPGWIVARMSQEHGILAWNDIAAAAAVAAGDRRETEGADTDKRHQDRGDDAADVADSQFRVGDKVKLACVHSCITAAAFHTYYVVDDDDVVQETWIPWKGW